MAFPGIESVYCAWIGSPHLRMWHYMKFRDSLLPDEEMTRAECVVGFWGMILVP